tara:strand:+ start:1175 stop:2431 length:1257 start_codon:yes stop_codon:yes gene_type:complete
MICIKKKDKKLLSKIFKNKYYNLPKSNGITLSEPIFDYDEYLNFNDVFISRKFSQGSRVKNFEKNFAKYIGYNYAVATNSGSSANLIALEALIKKYKIKRGSEVIIPASTFATVAMPIIQLGLVPVYVDICYETLNIDTSQIEGAISKKTKIIMPVHTLGLPCNMSQIVKIAKKRNLIIFEDCCEAHGASINKKKVGSYGKLSAFSFYVAHNITTIEGGMVLTNDKSLYLKLQSLREFGRIKNYKKRYYSFKKLKDYDVNYVFDTIGYNLRMSEIQAALGLSQLKKLNKFNTKRNLNAQKIKKIIKNYSDFIFTTKDISKYYNSYYTFPIIIKNNVNFSRKEICNFLNKHNIQTRPMMGGCLPDQPAFNKQPGRSFGNLKISRVIRDKCFFIGVHPMINNENLELLKKVLSKFFNERK